VAIPDPTVRLPSHGERHPGAPELSYSAYASQPWDEETQIAVEDRLTFFLSLIDDLGPFYSIGLTDPAIAPFVRQLYGYHQAKFLTPFEIACGAI